MISQTQIVGSRYVKNLSSLLKIIYSHHPSEYHALTTTGLKWDTGYIHKFPFRKVQTLLSRFFIGSYSKFFCFSYFIGFLPSMNVLVLNYNNNYQVFLPHGNLDWEAP